MSNPPYAESKAKRTARRRRYQPPGNTYIAENAVAVQRVFSNRELVPPRWSATMNWASIVSLVSTTTQGQCGAENVFRINSLFDPNLTGGTHQPYGFDQFAALYRRYRVNAITFELTVNTPFDAVQGWVVYQFQASAETFSLAGSAMSDIWEKNKAKAVATYCNGRPAKSRARHTISSIEGLTALQFDAQVEEYASITTADPTRQLFLRVAYATAGSVAITVPCMMGLRFEVEFFDRIVLASSN